MSRPDGTLRKVVAWGRSMLQDQGNEKSAYFDNNEIVVNLVCIYRPFRSRYLGRNNFRRGDKEIRQTSSGNIFFAETKGWISRTVSNETFDLKFTLHIRSRSLILG